jgi:hypothetical protein
MNTRPKFYTLEDMTQEDLNKLALERNKYVNIINELEKWLKEYKIQCKKYDSNSTIIVINCILDKLKELKGEEK